MFAAVGPILGRSSSRLNNAMGTSPFGSAGLSSFFRSRPASRGRTSTFMRRPLIGLTMSSSWKDVSIDLTKFSRFSAVVATFILPRIELIVLEKANLVLSRAASVTTRDFEIWICGAVHMGPCAVATEFVRAVEASKIAGTIFANACTHGTCEPPEQGRPIAGPTIVVGVGPSFTPRGETRPGRRSWFVQQSCSSMDELGLIEAIDRLGESVVGGIADAANRAFEISSRRLRTRHGPSSGMRSWTGQSFGLSTTVERPPSVGCSLPPSSASGRRSSCCAPACLASPPNSRPRMTSPMYSTRRGPAATKQIMKHLDAWLHSPS